METPARLSELRHKIDAVDVNLVKLLHERHNLVREVLQVKRRHKLPGRIQSRVDEVVNNASGRAADMGLDPDLARTVWTAMVEWFVKHEEHELNKA